MKVLVVGSGGREHALCWKLRQSPELSELFCAPGNPGIAELADLVPLSADEVHRLADFAQDLGVDLRWWVRSCLSPSASPTSSVSAAFRSSGLPGRRRSWRAARSSPSSSWSVTASQRPSSSRPQSK